MQTQEFSRARANRRRCYTSEPELSDLLRDPMTVALMAADNVDRHRLDALFDWARDSLRLRGRG
jgi:hypothetical protein